MVVRRLTSTRSADFAPLGTEGQRSFDLIRREMAELGPTHEALFAEPFVSPSGDSIDWYATVNGPATQLSKLEGAEKDQARERLNGLIADIQGRAETLVTEIDPERRRLGDALRNSIIYPDDDSVFVVGEQPVIVCWAHRSSKARAPVAALTTTEARAVPPTPPPSAIEGAAVAQPLATQTPVVVAHHQQAGASPLGWLWWILWGLVGVTAAAIAFVLLPACGLGGIFGLDYCSRNAPPIAIAEIDRGNDLEAELRRLERELGQRELACLPETPIIPPVEPEPEQRTENEEEEVFDDRVEREGGETDTPLNITLIWDSETDLDLHVTCPSNEKIFHRNRTACGGTLDVDQNTNNNKTSQPVENVAFQGTPASGEYVVKIENYEQRGNQTSNYKLRIQKPSGTKIHEGQLIGTGQSETYRFSYP